jgi:predicted DNA-binding transcriptional regulator AlpA
VDPATLAIRLDALAQAALLLAQDLRFSLAALGQDGPAGVVGKDPTSGDDRLLDAAGVAALFGVNLRTLRRMRHEQRAPKPLTKDPLRWRRSDVERWIEERAA